MLVLATGMRQKMILAKGVFVDAPGIQSIYGQTHNSSRNTLVRNQQMI
jgi:hypothetical protein